MEVIAEDAAVNTACQALRHDFSFGWVKEMLAGPFHYRSHPVCLPLMVPNRLSR